MVLYGKYKKGKKMLVHISEPARELLDKIARKRVGRAMGALDVAGCNEQLKTEIKKQFWEFKNEVESEVLESEENNGMDKDTN